MRDAAQGAHKRKAYEVVRLPSWRFDLSCWVAVSAIRCQRPAVHAAASSEHGVRLEVVAGAKRGAMTVAGATAVCWICCSQLGA